MMLLRYYRQNADLSQPGPPNRVWASLVIDDLVHQRHRFPDVCLAIIALLGEQDVDPANNMGRMRAHAVHAD